MRIRRYSTGCLLCIVAFIAMAIFQIRSLHELQARSIVALVGYFAIPLFAFRRFLFSRRPGLLGSRGAPAGEDAATAIFNFALLAVLVWIAVACAYFAGLFLYRHW